MKNVIPLFLLFVFLLSYQNGNAMHVVSDTLDVQTDPPDTPEEPADPEELSEEQEKPTEDIVIEPMRRVLSQGYHSVLTDSVLRWEQFSNPSEWYHNRFDAITFRLGMFGRHDYISVDGRNHNQHRFYYEGIPLVNRLTGQTNTNILPWHRIDRVSESKGGQFLHTNFQTQRFYVNRPLTWIHTDISDFNYRNTEVLLTRNMGRRTNLQASWWDKRSDPGFRRNLLQGNQFALSSHHHLTEQWKAEGGFLRTVLDMQEPNGFLIPNMDEFSFFEDSAQPQELNHESDRKDWLFYGRMLFRPNAYVPAMATGTIYHHSKNRRYVAPDTLRWKTSTTGFSLSGDYNMGTISTGVHAGTEWTSLSRRTSFTADLPDSWGNWYIHPRLGWSAMDFLSVDVSVFANQLIGSDLPVGSDELTFDAGIRLQLRPLSNLKFVLGQYTGQQVVPIIESLLRIDLDERLPEQFNRTEAGLEFSPFSEWKFYARGSLLTTDQSYIPDSANPGSFTQLSTNIGTSFDVNRWEGFFNIHYRESDAPYMPDQIVWIRSGLYYKNYIYERAAFMKAGVKGILSPFRYRTPEYNAAWDIWQLQIQDESLQIPAFQRVDIDINVRLRSAIFLLKFENVLGAFEPLVPSYFETANYPMPNYRFRFGLRWQLRN